MRHITINLLSKLTFMQNYFSGIITVFMLHRVHPFEPNKLSPNENMKVTPEFLERFIIELKLKGYEFISLDRMYEILQSGEKVKKQIVFTLDDGYRDNYEIAYPIFKKYNVPFTIYLTTSFPEHTALLWWYVLEDILTNHDTVILGGQQYLCKSNEEKNDLFMRLRSLILEFNKETFRDRLDDFFNYYKIDWEQKCTELCMNWDQIIKLSKDELCIIAGHTKNHLALNQLTEKHILDEIVQADKLIEEKICKKIEHFAYPFGSPNEVGQRELDIVKSLGFKTVTTTRLGNIYADHINHLECLPRIMLTENFQLTYIGRIRSTKVVTV